MLASTAQYGPLLDSDTIDDVDTEAGFVYGSPSSSSPDLSSKPEPSTSRLDFRHRVQHSPRLHRLRYAACPLKYRACHWAVVLLVVGPIAALYLVYVLTSPCDDPQNSVLSTLCAQDAAYEDVEYSSTDVVEESLKPDGWRYFNASSDRSSPHAPSPRKLRHLASQRAFSPACAEEWIANGDICSDLLVSNRKQNTDRLLESQIDIVWTWVTSNEHWTSWKEEALRHDFRERQQRSAISAGPASDRFPRNIDWAAVRSRPDIKSVWVSRVGGPKLHSGWLPADAGARPRRFRDHDELRFSQRSAARNLPFVRKYHLLSSDTPVCTPIRDTTCSVHSEPRIGEVPEWLDLVRIEGDASFNVQHHWDLFKTSDHNDAEGWRTNCLPSFNSLAIESQLANVDGAAENLLYLNDDTYMLRSMVSSDLATPLFGPVLRLQKDLPVMGKERGSSRNEPGSEWPGLEYSNWLLDQRFGQRARPYMVHAGKMISMPLLEEVSAIWAKELSETASIRFRGAATEVNMMFLATYYIIERHREALLWSFFVARHDREGKGSNTAVDRQRILDDLHSANTDKSTASEIKVRRPTRLGSSGEHSASLLQSVGIASPNQTSYAFSSANGYALSDLRQWQATWPTFDPNTVKNNRFSYPHDVCSIYMEQCFGTENFVEQGDTLSETLFKRVTFEQPGCGDCIITALLAKSGQSGLSAFLPQASASASPALSTEPVMLGNLAKSWQDADFSIHAHAQHGDLRTHAVQLLIRYSYAIGDTPTRFLSLQFPETAKWELSNLANLSQEDDGPAVATLNDDIESDDRARLIDDILYDWHNSMWPEVTQYEIAPLDGETM